MFGYVFISICKVNADQYNSNRTVMTHGQGIYSNIPAFYNKICAVTSVQIMGFGASLLDYTGLSIYIGAAAAIAAVREWEDQPFKH